MPATQAHPEVFVKLFGPGADVPQRHRSRRRARHRERHEVLARSHAVLARVARPDALRRASPA